MHLREALGELEQVGRVRGVLGPDCDVFGDEDLALGWEIGRVEQKIVGAQNIVEDVAWVVYDYCCP